MRRIFRSGLILAVLVSVLSPIKASAATTYTFTTASATGRTGPTQAQVDSAYSGTSLAGRVTISTQGIQRFSVPSAGRYQIELAGSKGGNSAVTGGSGARFTSDPVTLSAGEILQVGVGQIGLIVSDGTGAGGGGASWVYRQSSSTLLAIAGGGGGGGVSGVTNSKMSGQNDSSGNGQAGANSTGQQYLNGGSGGNGGTNTGNVCGLGGAGWFGNGPAPAQCNRSGPVAAIAINSTAVGGGAGSGSESGAHGGFGGAGAGAGNCGYGGGGGGYSGGGGGLYGSGCGGPGGAGGSFSSVGFNWVGVNAAAGFVTITSLGPALTTFTPRTAITNSSNITYDIVFSEAVTGLATNDFSVSGTGSSTCTIGSPSGSGTTYTIALSGCSPGTVILTMLANAVTNTDPQTAPSTNTAASTVVIDQTAPTISSVSAPSNATYIPAGALNFTVNFSESVTVTGTPRLTLTVGALTKYASFVSLTDSKTATFRYTVATASGEFDTDGISVSTTLDLNSGAIADLATNALSPLTFSAPTLTSVLVAQTPAAPTITSITPSSGTLSVAFTAGATNGSAITNYEFSTNNGANWTVRSPTATTSPISISGLTNGTAYNVRLRAVNAAGAGDSSTAVSATPSAVVVSGDATLTSIYGQAASTGTYTSSGGTGPYTYTLSASATGVTISSGVVTASASTPAGTYVRNVVSTDSAGTPQSGTRQLTITINKASTTITISLPGSASDAALGGAVTITANVSQAGSVNFRLGGTTISGCGTVASSGGTATCSWTPGALGGASLTAVLTPTDSSNYESATTSTLSITVVNGVTSLSLSLAGGVTQVPKGQNIVITATVDQAGRISFFVDGKRIAGCFNRVVATSSRTCTWKPSVQKQVTISSRLVPTNSAYSTADESMKVWVVRRTGTR